LGQNVIWLIWLVFSKAVAYFWLVFQMLFILFYFLPTLHRQFKRKIQNIETRGDSKMPVAWTAEQELQLFSSLTGSKPMGKC